MKINEYINKEGFACDLSKVNDLVNKGQASVSFGAARTITLNGYEDSISIDEIAIKVLQAGAERQKDDSLTTQERVNGLDIMGLLKSEEIYLRNL